MRRPLVSLLAVFVVATAAVVGSLVAGNHPELGLDLQGGAYVVLRPDREVESGIIDQSIEIIRSRVDALGVAEPDISRQGSSIIVQLPGVKDQQRALDIVGQTAELRFRPVLGVLPGDNAATTTTASTTTTAAPDASSTTAPPESTTTTAPGESTTTTAPLSLTPRDQDLPDQPVTLPEVDDGKVVRKYLLGPAELTGKVVRTARPRAPQGFTGDWSVTADFTSEGSKQFDEMAQRNFQKQVAIVLDGVVKSAPTINAQQFNGTAEITGKFTEREAKDLALVLRFGSLPVQLEPQSVQKVSATLGKDSLRAGVLAGLIGLGAVMVYMILYYRALGIVVVIGLGVSAMLMWSIVSFLGSTYGLALTLAGAVGIIVSVGVTVDSYVVYFERLKDEIRSGKTIRSSVDRGFSRAYRTILAADTSSLIGAALLYVLTVGSVRGFAFFLGLSALLDLAVAYFFTRPMVSLLGRNRLFTEAKWVGVARGLAATPRGATA